MTVEEFNLKQEIKEIVEKCIRCGLCNSHCPVLRIIREEHYSPRGMAIILDNGVFEKTIYQCNLCKACEENCPLNLKLCNAFVKARRVLVLQKKEIPELKEMKKNLEKIYGF